MTIRNRAVLVLAAAALCASAAARADDSSLQAGDHAPAGIAMAFDLALARPLGLGATVIGTAVFLVGLPFELLAGNVSDPARKLIVEPARFTFTRPLGEEIN
jgi:hypothetical protein